MEISAKGGGIFQTEGTVRAAIAGGSFREQLWADPWGGFKRRWGGGSEKGVKPPLWREQACSLTAKVGVWSSQVGVLMWCPPRRHIGRERLVAELPPGLFREMYGTSHLTKSVHTEREGNYQLGQKHSEERTWFGEGEELQSAGHTGKWTKQTLLPPSSLLTPVSSCLWKRGGLGKIGRAHQLIWHVRKYPRFQKLPISLTQMLNISWKI